jgi:2-oxoglutarate dehydrogenase complex dihydrolipoamide succinyltransferase (E2) component
VSSSDTEQNKTASSASRPGAAVVEVAMPQMGVSVADGTIVEWQKRPGDWVEADETIALVSTDKVDVEIPAPVSGRLERILVEVDETVAVGTTLAEIDAAARPGEAHPEEHHEPAEVAEKDVAKPGNGEPDRRGFHSPVVRRMAEEHGIDLSTVEGTGVGGRIRKADLVALIESGEAPASEGEPSGAEPAEPERPLHIESPYRAEEAVTPAANGGSMPGRRERMSPMRRQIAEHMLASRSTSAHCTTIVEVDMSAVAARRAELKDAMSRRGAPLTYLAFVARAAVEALQERPILNASIEGEEIVYHDQVNLGIAVALDDGLIVPLIRDAQRLSLEGMAAAIAELAERARSRELQPDDVQGGTFTITNPGQFGAVLATPIINQPQVAILDLEAIVKRPIAVELDGTDAIAIRPMTYLCMSWDHRALDGAQSAGFLADIKARLEDREANS